MLREHCVDRRPIRYDRRHQGVPLGNRRRLEAFLEAYNLTNYVTLTGGSSNMGLASFLLRTGARDARQIQWGARFVF